MRVPYFYNEGLDQEVMLVFARWEMGRKGQKCPKIGSSLAKTGVLAGLQAVGQEAHGQKAHGPFAP